MAKKKLYSLSAFFILLNFSCFGISSVPVYKRSIDYNCGWKFIKQDIPEGKDQNYADNFWRNLCLPHDISVEDLSIQDSLHIGPFYKKVKRGGDVGFFSGGVAWYRKHLKVDQKDREKQFVLHFDGIMSESEIYINGELAEHSVYGYRPFNVNITQFLKYDQDNVIAVKVINPEVNSRWFAGFGIYRDVRLSILAPLHIPEWGVYVTTPQVSSKQAKINFSVQLNNTTRNPRSILLTAKIVSPSEKVINKINREVDLDLGKSSIDLETYINNPNLWDVDNPDLYLIDLTLTSNGVVVDRFQQRFGVRSITFSAKDGFRLNKKEVLLQGTCMHHDNGLLGAAAFRKAEFRRVKIMKENGFNSIRTSHNPPSIHFLDACDELGVLVIDEAFDQWELQKRTNDYHQYFNENWEKDLEAMVLRDRNHPSIIMWSYGNEIEERSRPRGIEIAKMLDDKIKELDPTRPGTQAVCQFWDNKDQNWDEHTPATFAVTDIAGYNYMPHKYEQDHSLYPERIIYCSESLPKRAYSNWLKVKELPYVIGDYVWTGMDYLGEAGIGISKFVTEKQHLGHPQPWPWYISNCGDIDILGNKKPQSYYRDVVWGLSKLEILAHEPTPKGMWEQTHAWGWPLEDVHWNWDEHDTLDVSVYSSCPQVKLFQNGQIVGEQEIDLKESIKASFKVSYLPGELKAVGYENGREIATKFLKTTGEVSKISLESSDERLRADSYDIAFISVSALDQNDRFVTNASPSVSLEINGPAELLAAGSANPKIEGSLQDDEFMLYRGSGIVIVRSNGERGEIKISVKPKGLTTQEISVLAE